MLERLTTIVPHLSRNVSLKSTVNVSEVQKFSGMASEWWDVNGPLKAIHSLNKLRTPFFEQGIRSRQKSTVANARQAFPLAGFKVLDVGCGAGILTESLGRLGAEVTGIDPSEENIEVAHRHAKKINLKNVAYEAKTIEHFQTCNSTLFDAVIASEVVEHVDNPELFIEKCSESLKPGGSLFITTQNRTAASWALVICGAEYIMNVVPRGTHDWNKFITLDEMTSILDKNNCQLRQLRGYTYNPFLNNWDWIKSTDINYALHATKAV
ncbi:ubiquinone biosynthesis O-methyltransferase, mitochondrial-like isoform X1 [Daphnia pulicaria]|uniref:ubiquinone biosynthesis O-methyltransferase, mitochondrial-like isoform X1 n=2 Tax=Daphnia pulicaria TaxID=35523 RepID=UPI001EECA6E3|nr:ubiquinone biosynthesis O-methyltransferase, mitochondrial-like isoform X1 [Daphnia pulicaria]XP_046644395.1 ubiquinone biosynthesis O-methyltransferase, mitochondrial-like isoform X1 [Daphnia pulicaria]